MDSQMNADITKLSSTGMMFVKQIHEGVNRWDTLATLNALSRETDYINSIRHRNHDVYMLGGGTPEDQKLNTCLIHAYNRLQIVNRQLTDAAREYDKIMSDIADMVDTEKISEDLYRNDSE